MAKIKKPLVKVHCPHCQAAVVLDSSIVYLGGRVALFCPECQEVSIAPRG
ncbi:MAG TPA: hypothetical protein VJ456_03450 [Acidimicrobiia bacterium]|nr:hypothetical protein [Acidimicrobiia bacterium]